MSAESQAIAARLHAALRGMADALEAVRLEPFLEHAAALTIALAESPGTLSDKSDQRQAAIAEIAAARVQLVRGRRLGAAFNDLIGAAGIAEQWPGVYGRDGQPALPAASNAVNERG